VSDLSAAQLVARVTAGAVDGLNLSAHRVQAVAVPLTPKEYGDLRDSLAVVPATADALESAVVSDSPYAVRQHEELTWRHDDGEAKYLEKATLRSVQDVERIMAAAVQRALS